MGVQPTSSVPRYCSDTKRKEDVTCPALIKSYNANMVGTDRDVDAVKVLTQTPAVHTVSTGQEVVLRCNIQRDDNADIMLSAGINRFLVKLLSVSGVTVVTQKPPVVTVRKGETATMDCNLGTVTTNYGARWYKQIPGGVPQFVLKFHHSDRFRTPLYFISQSSNFSGSSLPPPVLTVFPPSSAELQSNKASLVCLSSQSVPFADVSWLSGGSPVSSGISTSTAVQQADRTFQISSYLAIQTSDWNMDKVYTCVSGVTVLTQKPPVVTVRKGETATMDCNLGTVTGSGCSLPPPVLTVFPPSSAELQSNKASLVCLSSQSVPFADVSWLSGGSPVSSGISTSTAVQQADRTFQISSYLAIQTSDWNMDKVYTCKVSLGSQTSEKNINKSSCPTEE
ncbi:hypothetical protein L3Q82_002558 [Scortum barcoo]|uniref:Uncharacterized protein n=1 Tax=Scortum barcoo TaxID=214431 RepID=A0ACB8VYN6_9TELE|nr:hypothetical protein L3Q82_002558 [Scortum barcoo]